MSEPNEPEPLEQVDVHPDAHRATEPDEEEILHELYGPPDADGIYRGPGPDDVDDEDDQEPEGEQ